uniref:sn-1-specific diacylglycerol lipase ABHD11 n=1 Tax=Setaria digitata TaxID=48799 RepID=A0A915PYU3_9BILA
MYGLFLQCKYNQLAQCFRLYSRHVELSFERFGEKGVRPQISPLVILHGLFGQKSNWQSIAANLRRILKNTVFTLDLRNHGSSPWHSTMTYAEMASDVRYFIDEIIPQQIGEFSKVHLLGHSMGGKTAMRVALMEDSDARLKSLIVEDIAPKVYSTFAFFQKTIEAMKSADLTGDRTEIERELATAITDRTTRSFLLTNLIAAGDGMYRWRLNLDSILHHIRELCGNGGLENESIYNGKCLFVSGGISDYVLPHDHPLILKHFPNAQFSVIPGAAHWVHAEKPYEFTDVVARFIHSVEHGREKNM